LTNLPPRKLKGVVSNGMILLSENEKGNFIFVAPEDKNIENGSPIN
jgi:methionyl-tRNA synthetase